MQHTIDELKQLQAMPLPVKVAMTKTRIRGWVNEYGRDGVYISFSGGKDSTVLLHIAREIYPDLKAVYVDTGLEYPEIREFVKTFENVDWLRPKMNFKQVIEKYGYPLFSKEISHKFSDLYSAHSKGKKSYTDDQLEGKYISKNGKTNKISIQRYKFMVNAPFKISHKCCDVMKKHPLKEYEKKTQKKPITAQMAEESVIRLQKWLQSGCNAFNNKRPISNPMSFWTEQDVLQYIKQNNIKIASVYGEVIIDYGEELKGQMDIAEIGLAEEVRPLKTTGCQRTGCMFCGFGCQMEKEGEGRFETMKTSHPKQYAYIMKPRSEGGLGYKDVIDWINEHGDLNIKY